MNLDERTMRLIAVGASVAANCQSCLEGNLCKAQAEGLSLQDLADAIEVGKMVRRGAASKVDQFIAGLAGAEAARAVAGCGCGSS